MLKNEGGKPCSSGKTLHVPGNSGKFFQKFAISSVERKFQIDRESDVGCIVDGKLMPKTEMSRLSVDFSSRLTHFKTVLGECEGSQSQLFLVVDAAVSQRVQSLIEHQRRNRYAEFPGGKGVSEESSPIRVLFV